MMRPIRFQPRRLAAADDFVAFVVAVIILAFLGVGIDTLVKYLIKYLMYLIN